MTTLVVQSHRDPLPYAWLSDCVESVRQWAFDQGFEYCFLDDEIFDLVSPDLRQKFSLRPVILSDLARLKLLKKYLSEGYERVLWLDADFLIYAPDQFLLPPSTELSEAYLLGREVWVQRRSDNANKLFAHKKVHNAFLLVGQGNAFLDFYTAQAEKLLRDSATSVPDQFIGPKLLTALHNVIQCPVLETAAMFSPEIILDLLSEDKHCCALQLLRKRSECKVPAANLCSSSVASGRLTEQQMQKVCDLLLDQAVAI